MLYEPLVNARHPKGAHSYIAGWDGSSYGGGIGFGGGSYHHNLLASGGSRTPRLDKYADGDKRDLIDIVNNVIYNWGGYGAYGGENADVNWQNNYYKWGPETSSEKRAIIFLPGDTCRMYVDGNFVESYPRVSNDNRLGIRASNLLTVDEILQDKPYPVLSINMENATDAFHSVLTHAGAILPLRDMADERIIQDVRNRTGKHIDSPSEVGGWPTLQSNDAPIDSDNDGMPDVWEDFKNLNPNNASDRNKLSDDGYTMLEKYLNAIEFSVPVENVHIVNNPGEYITIKWSDTYMNENGFIVERSADGENFEIIGETSSNDTSLIDNTATKTTHYWYRIKVKTNDWQCEYSGTVDTEILPEQVTYIAPDDYSTITLDTLTFKWQEAKNTDSYILYAGNDYNNMQKLYSGSQTRYKYDFHGNDNYTCWRVDAINQFGTTIGVTRNFNLKTNLKKYKQSQNMVSTYPNPGSGITYFSWYCHTDSEVKATIYNADGQKIKTITNETYGQGHHTIQWNGKNTNGEMIKNGIYFCLFSINNEIISLKLVRTSNK
jgi:hypothetical protein